ncbi:MAG: SxtJ family membrane protein [Candidatus Hodarchaeota archaeon]
MEKGEMVLNSNGSDKELRTFAFTLSCALGILGGLVLGRKGETGFLWWVIGMVILSMGLLKPRLLGPIHKGWMGISFLMGFFMTHLILALMYYLVFTPVVLVMRALDKNSLRLKHDRNTVSYWIKRPRGEFTKERYERMF